VHVKIDTVGPQHQPLTPVPPRASCNCACECPPHESATQNAFNLVTVEYAPGKGDDGGP
jgi:hypothetical protein